jgi:hypothetical protein
MNSMEDPGCTETRKNIWINKTIGDYGDKNCHHIWDSNFYENQFYPPRDPTTREHPSQLMGRVPYLCTTNKVCTVRFLTKIETKIILQNVRKNMKIIYFRVNSI